ncbi:MAG TPA: hypothetical protein VMV92_07785 [Streptosporangiaceae bacterium]|nr:hypothetical protein [Streptosporangiaceae bacterium]
MSGGFHNPLVGGGGDLVYPEMQSPNFVTGISGWKIAKDGSAEFQDIIIPAGSGGAVVTFASSAPASPHTGDLWYDTANGLELHQWDGSAWVAFQYGTGAIANAAVGTAQIASSAVTNALMATAAVGASNIIDGAVTATQISAAAAILGSQLSSSAGITGGQIAGSTITGTNLASSITARSLGGITTTISATAPGSPVAGDLWIDSAEGYQIKQYDGSAWNGVVQNAGWMLEGGTVGLGLLNTSTVTARALGGITTAIASTAPGSPVAGDIWIDSASGYQISQYSGSAWVAVSWTATDVITSGSITTALLASSVTARVLGGITTTIAATAPGSPAAGDIWINSTLGYQINQYSGAAWVAVTWTATDVIAAASIDASLIVAATITGSLIAAGTITASNIAANTITGGLIAAGTIDAANIAANTITAGQIASGTIIGSLIAASTITGGLIAANTITASNIAAGTIVASLIAADAITAGLIAAGAMDSMTLNAVTINGDTISAADILVSGTSGGLFVYSSGGTIVQTLTSGTTWKAPAGVTSVKTECWAGGGGGTGNGDGGPGGGEYAAEATLAVTAGNSYTYAVGAAGAAGAGSGASGGNGGNTTFAGDAVTVTAHGGTGAVAASTAGQAGGTGSINTAHYSGGAGGSGSSGGGGGGGGGSGGSGSAGNTGGSTSGSSGGAGATAVTGGGPGGRGGDSDAAGSAPSAGPGGGGGTAGGGPDHPSGAPGAAGQIRLTYTSATPVLTASLAGGSGTDPVAGHSTEPGITSYSGTAYAQMDGAAIHITNGSENSPAGIIDGGGNLTIESPVASTGQSSAVLVLTPSTTAPSVATTAVINPVLKAYKPATTSRLNTTSMSADPDLVLAGLAANAVYVVRMTLMNCAGAANPGLKWTFTVPSGSSGDMTYVSENSSSVLVTSDPGWITANAVNANNGLHMEGLLIMGASTGSLTLVWAQNTASASTNTKVGLGSFLTAERVA